MIIGSRPIGSPPEPKIQTGIAFMTICWAEGPMRLERLLRSVEPWFATRIVVLQDATPPERAVAERFATRVIDDKHHGYPEPSYDLARNAAIEEKCGWLFWVSGDETVDTELLASLKSFARKWPVLKAGAAEFLVSNTIETRDYGVLPAFYQVGERLLSTRLTMPSRVHGHAQGTKERPPRFIDNGFVRQHRTVKEFMIDHARYFRLGDVYAREVSARSVLHLRWTLRQHMAADKADAEMLDDLVLDDKAQIEEMLANYENPEATWQ